MDCTFSSSKQEPLTSEALMDAIKKMAVYHRPYAETKHPKWFEKIMNHFGWHRSPEIFIVKDSSFRVFPLEAGVKSNKGGEIK